MLADESRQISQREYAEETVFWSLKSATQFSARRRTTQLFLAAGNESSSSSGSEPRREYTWVDNTPRVWEELLTVLEAHQPATIAVDAHPEIAFSSGLHAGERDAITAALGPDWASRLVVEPMLAVEYIGTQAVGSARSDGSRLTWYRRMQETAWAIITTGFSEEVIVPGRTTPRDVEWWMREQIQALNYTTWFQPDVTIIRESEWPAAAGSDEEDGVDALKDEPIAYGNLLHVDFGVTAMGLNTDTQHLGYVLRPGETEADGVPAGLREGLRKGNQLQDMTRRHMLPGRTGNEILQAIRAEMAEVGIDGKIYCHSIGDWGHSAGTVIGETFPCALPLFVYPVVSRVDVDKEVAGTHTCTRTAEPRDTDSSATRHDQPPGQSPSAGRFAAPPAHLVQRRAHGPPLRPRAQRHAVVSPRGGRLLGRRRGRRRGELRVGVWPPGAVSPREAQGRVAAGGTVACSLGLIGLHSLLL